MANEVRLIDANILESWIDGGIQGAEEGQGNAPIVSLYDVLDELNSIPTVDAVEVVHGEWMEDYETFVDDSGKESYPIQTGYVCSECGKDGYPNWHYCPNCGAKMDGDGNG